MFFRRAREEYAKLKKERAEIKEERRELEELKEVHLPPVLVCQYSQEVLRGYEVLMKVIGCHCRQ